MPDIFDAVAPLPALPALPRATATPAPPTPATLAPPPVPDWRHEAEAEIARVPGLNAGGQAAVRQRFAARAAALAVPPPPPAVTTTPTPTAPTAPNVLPLLTTRPAAAAGDVFDQVEAAGGGAVGVGGGGGDVFDQVAAEAPTTTTTAGATAPAAVGFASPILPYGHQVTPPARETPAAIGTRRNNEYQRVVDFAGDRPNEILPGPQELAATPPTSPGEPSGPALPAGAQQAPTEEIERRAIAQRVAASRRVYAWRERNADLLDEDGPAVRPDRVVARLGDDPFPLDDLRQLGNAKEAQILYNQYRGLTDRAVGQAGRPTPGLNVLPNLAAKAAAAEAGLGPIIARTKAAVIDVAGQPLGPNTSEWFARVQADARRGVKDAEGLAAHARRVQQDVAENLPQTTAGELIGGGVDFGGKLAAGFVAGLATRNPRVGAAVFNGLFSADAAGTAYQAAKANGSDENRAVEDATFSGVKASLLAMLPGNWSALAKESAATRMAGAYVTGTAQNTGDAAVDQAWQSFVRGDPLDPGDVARIGEAFLSGGLPAAGIQGAGLAVARRAAPAPSAARAAEPGLSRPETMRTPAPQRGDYPGPPGGTPGAAEASPGQPAITRPGRPGEPGRAAAEAQTPPTDPAVPDPVVAAAPPPAVPDRTPEAPVVQREAQPPGAGELATPSDGQVRPAASVEAIGDGGRYLLVRGEGVTPGAGSVFGKDGLGGRWVENRGGWVFSRRREAEVRAEVERMNEPATVTDAEQPQAAPGAETPTAPQPRDPERAQYLADLEAERAAAIDDRRRRRAAADEGVPALPEPDPAREAEYDPRELAAAFGEARARFARDAAESVPRPEPLPAARADVTAAAVSAATQDDGGWRPSELPMVEMRALADRFGVEWTGRLDLAEKLDALHAQQPRTFAAGRRPATAAPERFTDPPRDDASVYAGDEGPNPPPPQPDAAPASPDPSGPAVRGDIFDRVAAEAATPPTAAPARAATPPPPRKPKARPEAERKLLEYYDQFNDDGRQAQAEAELEATGGDAVFRRNPKTKSGFPEEIEGQFTPAELGEMKRAGLIRLADEGERWAGGDDAMSAAALGEGGLVDNLRRQMEQRGRGKLRRAVEFVESYPDADPELRFIAAELRTRPDAGVPPKQRLAPGKLDVGDTATINGEPVRVEDVGGVKVLKDGDAIPETPVEYLDKVPVDKGSLKKGGTGETPVMQGPEGSQGPKEPWRMTAREWSAEIDQLRANAQGTGGDTRYGGMGRSTSLKGLTARVEAQNARRDFLTMGEKPRKLHEGDREAEMELPVSHEQVVRRALAEGKAVPPEVLAEYPGLKPRETVQQADAPAPAIDVRTRKYADPAAAQELINSLDEGELILSSGRAVTGRKMTAPELDVVRRSVEKTRERLGAMDTLDTAAETVQQADGPRSLIERLDTVADNARQRIKERVARREAAAANLTPAQRRQRGGGAYGPEDLADVIVIAGANLAKLGVKVGQVSRAAFHLTTETGRKLFQQWAESMRRDVPGIDKDTLNRAWATMRRLGRLDEQGQAEWWVKQLGTPVERVEPLTQIRRAVGMVRDPARAQTELGALATKLRAEAKAASAAYRAGEHAGAKAGRVEGYERRAIRAEVAQGYRDELARLVRENVPAAEAGRLIGDVARADTLGKLRLGVARAERIVRDAVERQKARALADVVGEARPPATPAANPAGAAAGAPGAAAPRAKAQGAQTREQWAAQQQSRGRVDPDRMRTEYRDAIKPLVRNLRERKVARGVGGLTKLLRDKASPVFDDAAIARLDAMEGRGVVELAPGDVEHLSNALRHADHLSRTENKLLSGGRAVELGEVVADAAARMAEQAKPLKRSLMQRVFNHAETDPEKSWAKRFFGQESEDADTRAIVQFGQGSRAADVLVENLAAGDSRATGLVRQKKRALQAVLDAEKVSADDVIRWQNQAERIDLPDGSAVELTPFERVSLINHAAAAENVRKVEAAGFALRRHEGAGVRGKAGDVAINRANLRAILATATPQEQAVARAMREQFAELFPFLNETHEASTGFALKQVEGEYWPLAYDDKHVQRGVDEQLRRFGTATLEGMGLVKPREAANAPVLVESALDTFNRHAESAARYIHKTLPVRDALLLIGNPTFRAETIARFGKEAIGDPGGTNGYWARHVVDSSGMVARERTWLSDASDTLGRNVAVGVLGLRPSSAVKQVAGLFNLATEFPGRTKLFFRHGLRELANMSDRDFMERVERYAPILAERWDQSPVHLATPSVTGDRTAIASSPAGRRFRAAQEASLSHILWADRRVGRVAWGAHEAMVRAEHPAWTDDQVWTETGRRTERSVDRTQNPTRPEAMSGVARTVGRVPILRWGLMFTSQSNKNWNILRREMALFTDSPMGAADYRRLARNTLAILTGQAVSAGITVAFGTGLTLAAKKVAGGSIDEEDREKLISGYLANLRREVFGNVYVLGDVADKAERAFTRAKGRGDNPPEGAADRVVEGAVDLIKALAADDEETFDSGRDKGESRKYTYYRRAAANVIPAIASLFGVPVDAPLGYYQRAARGVDQANEPPPDPRQESIKAKGKQTAEARKAAPASARALASEHAQLARIGREQLTAAEKARLAKLDAFADTYEAGLREIADAQAAGDAVGVNRARAALHKAAGAVDQIAVDPRLEAAKERDRRADLARDTLPKEARALVAERGRLERIGFANLAPEEKERLARLDGFAKTYDAAAKRVEAARAAGNARAADDARAELQQAARGVDAAPVDPRAMAVREREHADDRLRETLPAEVRGLASERARLARIPAAERTRDERVRLYRLGQFGEFHEAQFRRLKVARLRGDAATEQAVRAALAERAKPLVAPAPDAATPAPAGR